MGRYGRFHPVEQSIVEEEGRDGVEEIMTTSISLVRHSVTGCWYVVEGSSGLVTTLKRYPEMSLSRRVFQRKFCVVGIQGSSFHRGRYEGNYRNNGQSVFSSGKILYLSLTAREDNNDPIL